MIALALVVAAGLFLLLLGLASLAMPALAGRFLLGFAETPTKHYAELAVRLIVGTAFVLLAPDARFPGAFTLFGWLLLVTTACMLFIPWRWHRRFTERSVPQALRFLPVIGVASLLLGGLVLWAALAPGG